MVSNKKVANAVGGKTARACDNCIKRRARWYCTADDAFLCQTCDASVHSANPLASRHERVRLKTSSDKSSDESSLENFVPSWQRGFTRKPRTPRHGKQSIHQHRKSQEPTQNSHPMVPELGSGGETSNEENEDEQLLYRVPICDPFVAELCHSANSNEAARNIAIQSKSTLSELGHGSSNLHGLLPSESELAEFAADVESLLGKGLDEESFDMEGLGLLDCEEKISISMEDCSSDGGRVKIEDEETMNCVHVVDTETDMAREPFELNFDYDSHVGCEEDENKVGVGKIGEAKKKMKKKVLLRLDYEGVVSAWADQRSPWTAGDRPEVDPSECWPYCMGSCGTVHHPYGDIGVIGGHTAMGDGGREARVSRYREKRRKRLFSKKIRYEVRKLNAEKRPRMKGRFIKRANFTGPAFPLLNK
ncbi:hypothetical protein CsSME_00022376 [Camellia sinensis var. sinensis]